MICIAMPRSGAADLGSSQLCRGQPPSDGFGRWVEAPSDQQVRRLYNGLAFPASRRWLAQTAYGREHRQWLSGSAHIPHCGPPWGSLGFRKLKQVVPTRPPIGQRQGQPFGASTTLPSPHVTSPCGREAWVPPASHAGPPEPRQGCRMAGCRATSGEQRGGSGGEAEIGGPACLTGRATPGPRRQWCA